MTRFAITWLIAVTVAALGLFHVSHQVEQLKNELIREQRSILRDQETIHVLEAEWSYLNRPERIADLARRHLALVPLSADRMVSIQDLPQRQEPGAGLPVPGLISTETIPQSIVPTLTSSKVGTSSRTGP